MRAPATAPCWRRRRRSTSCALRYGENFAGTTQAVALRRDASTLDGVTVSASIRPAMCSARRRSRSSASGTAHRRLRRLQGRAPTRPARRSSWCPATSSSPRRHSACRCSAIGDAASEIAKLLAFGRAVSRARASRRRLFARQGAARHRADPRGRLRPADLPARRAWRSITRYYAAQRHRARRAARWCAAPRRRELAGAIALCPPSALQRPVVAPLSRSGDGLRVGLDAGARARPPARRRAAAGDLRPRRLGRADRDHRGDRRVARSGSRTAQEDALVHWCETHGLKARPLRHRRLWRRGRGDRRADGSRRRTSATP